MARFRAYTTDSEDEDSDAIPTPHLSEKRKERARDTNDAEEILDDDVMEEEELLQPRRNGYRGYSDQAESEEDATGDETGDEEQEQKHEGRTARFSATTRSPPARKAPTNPTIIPWARELGVDTQRLHVMQTSLFRMPEEEAAIRSMNQPHERRSVFSTALNRKHSRDSEGEGIRTDSRQVTSATARFLI